LGTGSMRKYQWLRSDDETIKSIDKVALLPALGLPVSPKINDLIVDSSSKKWKIKAVHQDPLKAHYELWIRPA